MKYFPKKDDSNIAVGISSIMRCACLQIHPFFFPDLGHKLYFVPFAKSIVLYVVSY